MTGIEYEANRISFVRSGVFGRRIRGALVVADPVQVMFVNRGDVHRFFYPAEGGNICTVLQPSDEFRTELLWHIHTVSGVTARGR